MVSTRGDSSARKRREKYNKTNAKSAPPASATTKLADGGVLTNACTHSSACAPGAARPSRIDSASHDAIDRGVRRLIE